MFIELRRLEALRSGGAKSVVRTHSSTRTLRSAGAPNIGWPATSINILAPLEPGTSSPILMYLRAYLSIVDVFDR